MSKKVDLKYEKLKQRAYSFGRGYSAWNEYVRETANRTPIQAPATQYIQLAEQYNKKALEAEPEKRLDFYLAADVSNVLAKRAKRQERIQFLKNIPTAIYGKYGKVVNFISSAKKSLNLEAMAASAAVVLFFFLFIPSITGNAISEQGIFLFSKVALSFIVLVLVVFLFWRLKKRSRK